MKPQQIAIRANTKHFGRNVAGHDQISLDQNTSPVSRRAKSPQMSTESGLNQTAPITVHSESSSIDHRLETQFRLDAPAAREVLLAADFTDWDKAPVKMVKGGGGIWHTKIGLTPGRHFYRFIVDGEWQDDPHCQWRVPNPFGTCDSIVEVG
jgi:1,4-alpha-glucan branching enzyme